MTRETLEDAARFELLMRHFRDKEEAEYDAQQGLESDFKLPEPTVRHVKCPRCWTRLIDSKKNPQLCNECINELEENDELDSW